MGAALGQLPTRLLAAVEGLARELQQMQMVVVEQVARTVRHHARICGLDAAAVHVGSAPVSIRGANAPAMSPSSSPIFYRVGAQSYASPLPAPG
jgi:hypothetical protein